MTFARPQDEHREKRYHFTNQIQNHTSNDGRTQDREKG